MLAYIQINWFFILEIYQTCKEKHPSNSALRQAKSNTASHVLIFY